MEIRKAVEKEEFVKCWKVVQILRPELDMEQYLMLMLHMLDERYKMIYIQENEEVVAICGYRHTTMLHRGRNIYIDDLCTRPDARGKGYASTLLQHVFDEAREGGMQSIHLDSGHQRYEAHHLYLNKGFRITAHHFATEVRRTGKQ
jgi:GNAT superfamily N-acetyltransferase